MVARVYLIAIGILYLSLSIWCTVQPAETSQKIGFQLIGGTGQSEFMTVYGGLECGMGLALLVAAARSSTALHGVWVCVLLRAPLVAFRTLSLVRFADFDPMIYRLAAGEWVIAIIGMILLWRARPAAATQP